MATHLTTFTAATSRLVLLSLLVSFTLSCLTQDSSPTYPLGGTVTTSTFISDGLSTIQSINVYYFQTTHYLYSLQVTDSNSAVMGTKVPNFSGAVGSLAQTINVNPSSLLITFKVWTKTMNHICGTNCAYCMMITQMEFLFSDGTSQMVNTPNYQASDVLYSFVAAPNKHIVGFKGLEQAATDTCNGFNSQLQIFYRFKTCSQALTVNMATIQDQGLSIFSGVSKTLTFTTNALPADMCGLVCTSAKSFQLTVSNGPNLSLITLPDQTTPTIAFAASNALADVGSYTLAVKAQFDQDYAAGVWSNQATATFHYTQCDAATVQDTCQSNFVTQIGYADSVQSIWTDNVSSALGTGNVVCVQTVSHYVSSAPSAIANNTMHTKFSLTVYQNTSLAKITASPTLCDEFGTYTIQTNQYLTQNTASTASCSVVVQVNYAAKIIQASGGGILQAQSWVISFTSPFTYQLAVSPTSTCNNVASSWTLTSTSSDNPSSVSLFRTIDSNGFFSAGPFQNVLTEGTYKIFVNAVTLNGVNHTYATGSIFHNSASSPRFFVLYVLNPCWLTTLTYTSSVSAMSCSVLQAASCTQQVPQTFNDALSSSQSQTLTICGGLSYSISDSPAIGVTALTAAELQVSTTGLITVAATTASKVGAHTVTVITMLSAYTNITSSQTFSLTITPCVLTSVQVVQTGSLNALTAQTYTLSSSAVLTYDLTTIQTPACGYAPSGWLVTSTANTGATPNPFNVINSSTGVYSIPATTSNTFKGTYTIAVAAITINGFDWTSQLISPSQFTLTVVSPCASTIVSAVTILPISLKVWQGSSTAVYNTFGTFSDSVSTANNLPGMCPISYSATITTNSNGQNLSTFNLVSQSFNIYSSNMNQIGSYTVTLTGKVTLFPSQSAQTTFDITIIDPCTSTSFIVPSQLLPMTTSVKVQDGSGNPLSVQQQAQVFNDTVSVAHGNGSGIDICGQRIYSIISNPQAPALSLTSTELSIVSVSGQISIYTANNNKIGTHNAVMSVSLANYAGVTSVTQQFKITINPCQVTSFTSTIPNPINYNIKQPAVTWSLNSMSVQVPACGYSQVISIDMSTVPTYVTVLSGSSLNFSVQTSLLAAVNSYDIKIIETLTGTTQSPIPTCFVIQTLNIVDECRFTLISGPTAIESFAQFGGYTSTSIQTYTFNDTKSQLLTQISAASDFCGAKIFTFTVNSIQTDQLKGNNSQVITFSPTKDKSSFGTYTAVLTVFMDLYPNIIQQIQFQVTTLGSQLPYIESQAYQISDPVLLIQVGQFSVLPIAYASQNNLISSVSVHLLASGMQLPQQLMLNDSALTNIKNSTWIQFDSQINTISVFTKNQSQVGNYTVVVVQSFGQTFPNVNPYITFNLTVTYQAFFVDLTPIRSMDVITVTIGDQNSSILLLNYYNIKLSPVYILTLSVTQIYGPVLTDLVSVDANYNLNYQTNDTSLNGQSAQFQIFATTNLPNQTSNSDLTISLVFKIFQNTPSAIEENKNQTTASSQKVGSDQKYDFIFNQTFKPAKKSNLNQKSQSPAFIASITQYGLVTIKFAHQILVPEFSKFPTSGPNSSRSRLLSNKTSLSLQQFIGSDTLLVKKQNYKGTETLNWTCTELNSENLKLQLEFSNPLEVSAYSKDLLIVKFNQPNIFVLSTMTDLLFSNDQQKTIHYELPQQFPSKSTEAAFQSLSNQLNKMSTATIIVTLLIQIVAKKVIGSMYVYLCVLQIILLVNLNGQMFLPASVGVLLTSVDGIINLSSFDKKSLGEKLKIPPDLFQQGSLLGSLGGVALMAVAILVFIVLFFILGLCLKQTKSGQKLLIWLKNFLFWNFLIRYFQIAFINFNYAAIKSVQKAASIKEVIISSNILAVLYSIVVFISYILWTRPFEYLNIEETKKKIGNLYQNLNCFDRSKLAYGTLFFVQRGLIVTVIAFEKSYGIQWQCVYLIIFMNTIYLFCVQPFIRWSDARVEYLNVLILWGTHIFQVVISNFISDLQVRFQNGIYFDVIFGLGILLNVLYVCMLSITQLKLKFMQFQYRRWAKKAKKEKEIQIQKGLQTALKRLERAREQQDMIRKQQKMQQAIFHQKLERESVQLRKDLQELHTKKQNQPRLEIEAKAIADREEQVLNQEIEDMQNALAREQQALVEQKLKHYQAQQQQIKRDSQIEEELQRQQRLAKLNHEQQKIKIPIPLSPPRKESHIPQQPQSNYLVDQLQTNYQNEQNNATKDARKQKQIASYHEHINQMIFLSQMKKTDESYLKTQNSQNSLQGNNQSHNLQQNQSLVKNNESSLVQMKRKAPVSRNQNQQNQHNYTVSFSQNNQQEEELKSQQKFESPLYEAIVFYQKQYHQQRQQTNSKYYGQKVRVETAYEKDARFCDWLRDLDVQDKLEVPIEDIKEVWLRFDQIMSQQRFGLEYI